MSSSHTHTTHTHTHTHTHYNTSSRFAGIFGWKILWSSGLDCCSPNGIIAPSHLPPYSQLLWGSDSNIPFQPKCGQSCQHIHTKHINKKVTHDNMKWMKWLVYMFVLHMIFFDALTHNKNNKVIFHHKYGWTLFWIETVDLNLFRLATRSDKLLGLLTAKAIESFRSSAHTHT